MQNPFSNPAFSMANLTAAINLLPNRYGRLESLNLFPVKPVRFRQILIEEKICEPVLLGPEHVAGAADLEVAHGDLEARAEHGVLLDGLEASARGVGDGAVLGGSR